MESSAAQRKPRSPLGTIHLALEPELARVEQLLHDVSWGPVPVMTEVASHLVEAGGKRLRPALCLLSARMCGIEIETALPIAAASEMIHSASLLHDDVVDATPLRRGRPAAPRVFGNSTCVLVGDALMARSLVMLGQMADHAPLTSLARCVRRMATGELQQLSQAGRPHPRLLGYLRVVDGKTSALFAWCTTVGTLCPPALQLHLANFGRRLGMSFQIADDVLDYSGDPALTGKSVGSDLGEGKFTLPLHYACQDDPLLMKLATRMASSNQPPAPDDLSHLVSLVQKGTGLEQAQGVASALLDRAHRALNHAPAGPWRDHLHSVADFVVHRKF